MTDISRDPIIQLQPYINQKLLLNFLGGRVVEGVLKGFDHVNNLVLNDVVEHLRDPKDPYSASGKTRKLGLLIVKGTAVSIIPVLKNRFRPSALLKVWRR